jgi:ribosome-associated toxin RatA of RatAB toxin-antitoxin module
MGENVVVEQVVKAPAGEVWAIVSDVTRMCEFSPENTGCEWIKGSTEPSVGARFRGTNENGKKQWKTDATVVEAEPGKSFAFVVKAGPISVARWEYRIDAIHGAECRVTETWTDQRNALSTFISGRVSGVADRASHNRAGMETTLARLAAAAEKTSA